MSSSLAFFIPQIYIFISALHYNGVLHHILASFVVLQLPKVLQPMIGVPGGGMGGNFWVEIYVNTKKKHIDP